MSRGAAPATVGPYLARVLDEPSWRRCEVDLITGGRSNLTYAVTSPAGRLVLRRPPLRAVRPTAHDMGREYRVLTALVDTAVPVPRPLHLCEDTAVLGAPFYVMEYVDGVIARPGLPDGYAETPAARTEIAAGLVDTLAALHAVEPAAVGLAEFGRPDGYLARQVRRWVGQWDAWRDRDRPGLETLARRLAGGVPAGRSGPVVHGDYRLDNVVLDRTEPGRIAAVLDWEMSTLGDPLADLGLLLVYWTEPGETPAGTQRVVPAVTALPGFPTRAQVVARYAERSGRDVDDLAWYVAFGFFKLAVVVAGIAARERAGAMVTGDTAGDTTGGGNGGGADGNDGGGGAGIVTGASLAAVIDPLVERGRGVLESGAV